MSAYSLEEIKQECENFSDPKYVFKLCSDEKTSEKYFVILMKDTGIITNEERKVDEKLFAKYRANKLLVTKILCLDDKTKKVDVVTHKSEFYKDAPITIYKLDKIVEADSFNDYIESVCSNGIHYYLDISTAFYNRKAPLDYTGEWITRYDNGRMHTQRTFNNGTCDKSWKLWRDDGSLFE